MKVLVTGGAGFIGSNLVKLLLKEHYEVVVLDNLSTGVKENLYDLPITFLIGDITQPSDLDRIMPGVEVVFHLAASVGRQKSIDFPLEDSQINVIGTIEVLEAMLRHGVQKIVYSSSAAIFGELETEDIKEDHPINANSPYGVSKLAAEKLILSYSEIHNIDAVCLRYFNIYGNHQRFDAYGNVIPIFAKRLFFNEPIIIYGSGEQKRDFVHVDDVARANLLAAQSPLKAGVVNLGTGSALSILELAKLMMVLTMRKVPIIHESFRPGDVMNAKANTEYAESVLKFKAQLGLEEGLIHYLKWFEKVALKELKG